jgi:hypothetical protein
MMEKKFTALFVAAVLFSFASQAAFAAAKAAPEPLSMDDKAEYEYVMSESGYVTALVRENDGKAFVRIGNGIKEDYSPQELKHYKAKIGKAIMVSGRGGYVSAFAGMIGNGGMNYVMLLRRDGGADVVDISKGIQNGFAFKAQPVAGLKNVVRFELQADMDGSDIRAVKSDGHKVIMYDLLKKQHLLQ